MTFKLKRWPIPRRAGLGIFLVACVGIFAACRHQLSTAALKRRQQQIAQRLVSQGNDVFWGGSDTFLAKMPFVRRVPFILELFSTQSIKSVSINYSGDEQVFDDIVNISSIVHICLNDSHITNNDLGRLASLATLESLKIDGGKTRITDSGLFCLRRMPHLNTLELDGPCFTDVGISALRGLRQITSLSIIGTQVSRIGLKDVATLSELRELFLSETGIADDDLTILTQLPHLEVINLSRTKIGDIGIEHINKCDSLRILHLEDTSVGDIGIQRLTTFGLEELHLDRTQITDKGLLHLSMIKGLSRLCLHDTKTTVKGRGILREQLPDCYIQPNP